MWDLTTVMLAHRFCVFLYIIHGIYIKFINKILLCLCELNKTFKITNNKNVLLPSTYLLVILLIS